jgi:hypothetical protein
MSNLSPTHIRDMRILRIALVTKFFGMCGGVITLVNPWNINAHSLELLMKIARLIHPSSETRAFTSLPPCKLSENFSNMQAKLLENGACIKLLQPADARVDGNTIINLGKKYAVESIVQGEPPVRSTIITDITTNNPPPPTVYRTQMYRSIAP